MTTRTFAYCRVSTADQSPQMQVDAIKKRYPDAVIYDEQVSATTRKDRVQLQALLKALREGDTVVVWKLDRLARNLGDLLSLVDEITEAGASLVILDQNIDTSTASGRAFLQMLGVFAEFETNLRKERQLEGIAKAKREGKHLGRPQLSPEKREAVVSALEEGRPKNAIGGLVGVSRAMVYRIAKEIKEKGAV